MTGESPTTRCCVGSSYASCLALVLGFLMLHTPLGCDGESRLVRRDGPLRVAVTIPPLREFAEALAPADAEVSVLLPPGASPHGHEPTPGAIARLVRADVVIMVGLGLEPQAHAALNKHPRRWRRVVCFADELDHEALHGYKSALPAEDASHDCGHDHTHHGHQHTDDEDAHSCDHDHGPVDTHLWLDPALVERLIPAIRREIEAALRGMDRLDEAELARLDETERRLIEGARAVHQEYEQAIAELDARTIVTHHDAYSRIAARYGLHVAAVIRPIESLETTPGAVGRAVDTIRSRNISTIFIEPQFSAGAAGKIAELTGVRIRTLDPLGDGDWQGMMRRNLQSLREGLGAPVAEASPARADL